MWSEWPIIITTGLCIVLSAFIMPITFLPAKKKVVVDVTDPTASSAGGFLGHAHQASVLDQGAPSMTEFPVLQEDKTNRGCFI